MPRPNVILLAAMTLAFRAQGAAAQAPTTPEDVARAEAAVVRLLFDAAEGEASSGCTGVFAAVGAARDEVAVLTAGHCLGPDGLGRPSVRLGRAEDGGRLLRPEDGQRHPGGGDVGALDIARLELDAAGPALPVGKPPLTGETLLLLGYRNDMRGALTELYCPVLFVKGGLALVDCPVAGGLSGSPLLRLTPGGVEIAALVIARTGPRALAVVPDAWAVSPLPAD